MWPEAIALAEAYVTDAPAPSTYLRDRKDEAAAFAAEVRAQLGDAAQSVAFFDELLARKPQHYGHRLQAARVRLLAADAAGALRLLEQGGRLLSAGGQRRTDYEVTQAEALAKLGHTDSARAKLRRVLAASDRFTTDERLRVMNALVAAGLTAVADSIAPTDTTLLSPRQRRDLARVEARLQWQQQPAPSQQTARIRVTGQIIDESTKAPVATAVVRLERVSRAVVTDTLGRFVLDPIPSGKHRLEAARIGYITAVADVDLSEGDTLIVEMQPQPVVLEAVTAIADRLKARRNRTPVAVRAYDLRTLADYAGNLKQFLQSRGAFFAPCPRGRAAFFADDCASVRGRTVPVTLYVDESRFGGPLDTYYPQEFELVEYYPSHAMVRVYTRTFLERVAKGRAFISPIL
jgi:hypothetical protein